MNEAFIGDIGMEPIACMEVAGIDPVAETMEDVIFILLGFVFLLLLRDRIWNLFEDGSYFDLLSET